MKDFPKIKVNVTMDVHGYKVMKPNKSKIKSKTISLINIFINMQDSICHSL